MKKERRSGIHTNAKQLSTAFRIIRGALKLLGFIAPGITVKIIFGLLCKPVRRKIRKKHVLFYEHADTEILRLMGYTIKVFKQGTGKTIFLIHGWSSFGYDMKNVAAALVKEGYRVIMPDLPCHGHSSGKYIDQIKMSKVIKALLLHYNSQFPVEHIVTHSWGGIVSLLAMDRIMKSNNAELPLKSMVSVSMPTHLNAIIDIFCEALDLSEAMRKKLMLYLKRIAQKDQRTMEEAFPMGMNDLLHQARFHYLLIHGTGDIAISYTNSTQLSDKFPHIQTELKDGLGHIDILRDKTVHAAIINHIAMASDNRESLTTA